MESRQLGGPGVPKVSKMVSDRKLKAVAPRLRLYGDLAFLLFMTKPSIDQLFFQPVNLVWPYLERMGMSALGHKRPLSLILAQRLLLGGNRTLRDL